MEFRGWNTELENGTWFKALNFKLDTKSKRLHLEFDDVNITKTEVEAQICGEIELPDSSIFFLKLTGADAIIEFKESEAELRFIIISEYLGFSLDNWIKGIYTTNNKNERVIMFWEGFVVDYNVPRIVNIDIETTLTADTDAISLFPKLSATTITETELISGSLPVGKYKIGISYDLKTGISNVVNWSEDIMLYSYKNVDDLDSLLCTKSGLNSNNGLKLVIGNVDDTFKDVYINIAVYQDKELIVYRSKKAKSLAGNTDIVIGNLLNYERIDSSIFIDNVQFENFEDGTIQSNRFVIGNYKLQGETYPGGTTDADLQDVANRLRIIFTRDYVPIESSANPINDNRSLLAGEVYDIKIRFAYGALKTKAYHIPGPVGTPEFNADEDINGKLHPFYTVRDTTTVEVGVTGTGERISGYYPNKSINYPSNFGDISNQEVRFHKTPMLTSGYPLILDDKMLRIGMKLHGNIPSLGGITHYEILYTKRTTSNANVIVIDHMQHDGITYKGKKTLYTNHLDIYKNNDVVSLSPKVVLIHEFTNLKRTEKGTILKKRIDVENNNDSFPTYSLFNIDGIVYARDTRETVDYAYNIDVSAYMLQGSIKSPQTLTDDFGDFEAGSSYDPVRFMHDRFAITSIDEGQNNIPAFDDLRGFDWGPSYLSRIPSETYTVTYKTFNTSSDTRQVYLSSLLNINLNPYSDFLDSEMITTGKLISVSSREVIFGFDVIPSYTGHRRLSTDYLLKGSHVGEYVLTSRLTTSYYYFLANIGIANAYNRIIGSEIKQEIYYPYRKVFLDDIDGSPLNDHAFIKNWYGFNDDSNQLYPIPVEIYNPSQVNIYRNPYGIYFSDVEVNESKIIGFRSFKPLNYIESKRDIGHIKGLVTTANELIVLHEFGIIRANTQVTLEGNNTLIQIKTIDFSDLKLDEILESKGGTVGIDNKTDMCVTDVGLFLFSYREKAIYLYNGQLINISKLGLEKLYHFQYAIMNSNPVEGLRRNMAYDRRNRRLLVAMRDASKSFITTFDLDNLVWISEHTYNDSIHLFSVGSNTFSITKDTVLEFNKLDSSDICKEGYVIFSFIYAKPTKLSSIIGKIISVNNNDEESPIPYSVQIITRQGISDEIILTSKNYYTRNYTTHNGEFYVKNFNNILKENTPSIIGLNGEILEIKPNFIEEKWYSKKAFKANEILVKLRFTNTKPIAIENLKLLN
jgi:hypothetical protein